MTIKLIISLTVVAVICDVIPLLTFTHAVSVIERIAVEDGNLLKKLVFNDEATF